MGIETEYGVLRPGVPHANPVLLSGQVVSAYRGATAPRARAGWDYVDEDPLADARGFHLDRRGAHPSLLTDDPSRSAPGAGVQDVERGAGTADPGVTNAVLSNGARLYVDHAHPEYSSPEVTTPRDLVVWDRAGERIMCAAQRVLAEGGTDVALYKNNVDGKGASYGTHENYLMDRQVPFADVVRLLTTFLVTRQVFAGSGRVGIGPRGEADGFQLSQRADYIETEVGLETTLRRPIVNTRDEPHADRGRWRRLHLIAGDANLLEPATYLKAGTTSLVLSVLERLEDHPDAAVRLDALRLADPVGAVRTVSRDLSLTAPLTLTDGTRRTALELQGEYLRVCRELSAADRSTTAVLDRWEDVLVRLARSTSECARDVEWVAKLRLLEGMRSRDASGWDDPRLAAFDLQWSDVRPQRGIARRLEAAGALDRLTTDAEVDAAVTDPPHDTRAFFRGGVVSRYPDELSAVSWDSVVFDVAGSESLQRVPMLDPWRGTRDVVGPLLAAHPGAAGFLRALSGRG
ncbi:MAG: depupylase/deamidase Dop [Cellulomonadaceae bacterium]